MRFSNPLQQFLRANEINESVNQNKQEESVMDKQVVYQFDRNQNEKVIVSIGNYKDRNYVDFRVFFEDASSGDLKPTKKGITIAENLLPHMKRAIMACEKTKVPTNTLKA